MTVTIFAPLLASPMQGIELVEKSSGKKSLNYPSFQRVAQVCSVDNFSVLERFQSLIRVPENQYTTEAIQLCKKVSIHLWGKNVLDEFSDKEIVEKVTGTVEIFWEGLSAVRKNWDRDGLFYKLTQEDLYNGVRDKVKNGELISGQVVLIEGVDGDIEFSVLDNDLIEGEKGELERKEFFEGLDPSGNSFDSVESLSSEELIEDTAWNKNFTPIFPEDEPDYVLIDSPLDIQNKNFLQDPIFKKLVQICSVNDFSVDVWRGTSVKILDRLQNLIASSKHLPSDIRFAKKIYAHLLYNGIVRKIQGSDQKIISMLKDLITPYIDDIRTVLRNIDIYKELCFPSFPGSITGRDLLGYVGRGELVPGQWVLIDNMLECVNDRLIERMERDGTGGQDDLCDSLEEWLRV